MMTNPVTTDTIFALATAPGRGGVAVMRVSGPRARDVLSKIAGVTGPAPRRMTQAMLAHGGVPIDAALVVYFKSPASFTGEDVVEFHTHGGRAVTDALSGALSALGLRPAEPGEFSKRAFANGKMDLTAAEGIADLINAETEAQRQQAFAQMGGALTRLYMGWTERLTTLLAHQEADIEFPDEDMPTGVSAAVIDDVRALSAGISAHLADFRRGERLRDGLRVAIIGAPNAGKSTLLNVLAGRAAAIVSPEAGTTRDVIDVALDLGGYPVIFSDTAGLRQTDHAIEAEGIRRAESAARDADIKVALFCGVIDAETQALVDDDTIVVFSQCDRAAPPAHSFPAVLQVSAHSAQGMDAFMAELKHRVADKCSGRSAPPTRERHRHHLQATADFLMRAQTVQLPELAAEDLRLALRELGALTGRVHIEDILDRVFKDFCIGK
jgi:tRNA modification GTPase